MGVTTFIDNLLASNFSYTETQLLQLKELCSQLHKLLNDIYSTRKSDVSKRTYQSISSYKVLQTKLPHNPDLFYNFRYNDVSICIVLFHNLYYVSVAGFKVSIVSVQTVLDSQVLSDVDLFSSSENDPKDLLDEYQLDKVLRSDSVYIGGFDFSKFDEIKLVYSTIVSMYLNSICV